MCWRYEAADARRAVAAREDLLDFLADQASDDSDVEAAALIFGELVGNVVRHAPGPIDLELEWDGEGAVLHVFDRGPGFEWRLPSLPDPLCEDGRGLFIVSALARRIAFSRRPDRGMEAVAWLPVARRTVNSA